VYQVGINKGIIQRCTAYQISRFALHNLTLITMNVARFVGTGHFLIIYSNGNTKCTHSHQKKFRDYFQQNIPLVKETSHIQSSQSSHYRTVSTDPLGPGRGSHGIRGPHFGNR